MYDSPNENNKTQTTISNYILGKTIGEGSFSKVKLAIHPPTGEYVAIKIILKSKIIEVN